jgi:hypothetical protein
MVGAQAVPEYGMDSYDKKSYGKDSDESSDDAKDSDESSDDAKDSDESSDDAKDSDELEYGTDSYDKKPSYGSEPEYGMDSYDKKAYGNDDYGTQYSSYGKDNSYKSKDSNSVTVKKVKCNNINVNVNGLDLNLTSVPLFSKVLGFEAQESDEGYSGASSYGNNGGNYGDKSRSDGDFKFICINNNNNTVIGDGDGDGNGNGNGNGNVDECESCFDEVTLTFPIVVDLPNLEITIDNFQELCDLIFSPPFSESAEQLLRLVEEIVPDATPQTVIDEIVCDCLVPLLGIQGACPPGPPPT